MSAIFLDLCIYQLVGISMTTGWRSSSFSMQKIGFAIEGSRAQFTCKI